MTWRMMRIGLAIALAISTAPVFGQAIHPGKTGNELETLVRGSHKPSQVLSYASAKDAMFKTIDNQGGLVRLIYTGDAIPTMVVPPHQFVNAEHVWPQSKFGPGTTGKKSDLHHLFPCYASVNTDRANHPFGEIPDAATKKWWKSNTFITGIPGTDVEQFSESINGRFEPREGDKGNIARAMFYFRAIYGDKNIDLDFFKNQQPTLLSWHKVDPADAAERDRNSRVFVFQGNRNPFIDDETLAERMFGPAPPMPIVAAPAATSGTAPGVAGAASGATPPAANGATIQEGEEIDIMTWNLRFFYDADQSDNFSTLGKDQSADTAAEFQDRVVKIAKIIKACGLPEIVALQEVENQKVVDALAKELNTNHQAKYKVGFKQGTDTHTEQDVAFLYEDRQIQVSFRRIDDLFAGDFQNASIYKMPSKHCVMSISHQLPNGSTQKLSLVNCHLKAGSGGSNETQRKKQSRVLCGVVGKIVKAESNHGVIVLGDMNASRTVEATGLSDAMGVLTGLETPDPADDLLDLHQELPNNQRATHVGGKELDRILTNGVLQDDVGLVFRQIVVRRDLISGESDHFPVIATFTYRSNPGP